MAAGRSCSVTMPVAPAWPYKRPFYQPTLTKHEIQADLSYILSQTKREPRQPGRFHDQPK
ncbi:hypothetical protein TSOC_008398 [Tetrabaena socialis]|uniref:Uncharacterized protein n=1 Tax=Tetrabaena socialis TaxID=47790 RepID=A0A2J7ZYI0_9CHLO|nr:hypothetical protein TSOC_008398 [Tetrabaena socialis]|eukprot:PNH05327.1 hypothetical protein TSOC_008398 [Tetrabaena socialis]